MDTQKINELYDRLDKLPESHQVFLLSGIFGTLFGRAENGDTFAKEILIDIEKTVTTFENKKSAK